LSGDDSVHPTAGIERVKKSNTGVSKRFISSVVSLSASELAPHFDGTETASCRGMNDNSLALNSAKFYGETETEHEEEALEQRRRQVSGRIRGVIALLMLAAIMALAYCWRAELQFLFFSKAAM
jgi:hypothetical protein